jgi:hypothetical protein
MLDQATEMEKCAAMNKILRVLLIGMLTGFVLAGCSQDNTTPNETVSVETPTKSVIAEDPTATPSPPVVMLLASPESDAANVAAVQAEVENIALERGMVFEHRQILSAESAPENLQLVIALPPVNDLAGLAAALPQTKFVALNVPGVTSRGNLVSIGSEQASDVQAFMAGYIAAVQSDDWRVGIIFVGDEAGRTYQNAFLSGAIYFCGFCNPYFPPYYEYPVYYEVPVGSSVESFQVAADDLIAKGVNTVHLAPGAQMEEIFRYLAERSMRFVGTEAPPTGLEANWIASVVSRGEIDLRQVVNQVLNGQVDFEANSSLQITFTGLSEARVTHYNEVMQQLVSGMIDPQGVDIE